jgi:hypothetical protein
MKSYQKKLTTKETDELLSLLQARFEKNKKRHKDIEWQAVEAKLNTNTEKLWSLLAMENTGGEPDVVGYDKKTDEYIFMIAQSKARKIAEAYVTTSMRGIREKRINQKIMLLM